jgi:hypothetical protein
MSALTYTPAVRSPGGRWRWAWLGSAALAAALGLAAPAVGQASVDKDGWWNRVSGPQEGLPDLGLPAPPTIPPTAIAVSALGAELDKVAAVGMLLDAAPGSTPLDLTMRLLETPEPGANVGPADVSVVACPITSFWGLSRNGAWIDRPSWDCGLAAVKGVRAADGAWTFNLLPIAALWLRSDAPLEPNGVALMIDITQGPETAQVAFRDRTTGDLKLTFSATPPDAAAVEPPAAEPPAPGVEAPAVAPPLSFPDVAAPAAEEPAPAILNTTPALVRGEPIGDTNVFGNLPVAAAVLIPVMLGVAMLLSYVLGPAGEPEAGMLERRGSITKALDRQKTENR